MVSPDYFRIAKTVLWIALYILQHASGHGWGLSMQTTAAVDSAEYVLVVDVMALYRNISLVGAKEAHFLSTEDSRAVPMRPDMVSD